MGTRALLSGNRYPPKKQQHNKIGDGATLRRRRKTDKSPGGALERGLEQRPQLAREVVAAEHLLVGRVAVLVQ